MASRDSVFLDISSPRGQEAAQARVSALRLAGVEITPGQVLRIENMQRLQQQTAVELARYAQYANGVITQANREAIAAGSREAAELMETSFPRRTLEGIVINRPVIPARAAEALIAQLPDGTPLADIIRRIAGDAYRGFSDTLVNGLVSGWNPRRLADELRRAYGTGLTETLRLARTEILRAHRQAASQTYQENSEYLRGWERLAAKDERTCMACLILDGKFYPLDAPMDDHVQGRCAMCPVTKSYAELGLAGEEPDFKRQLGKDWFLEQDSEVQQRMMGTAKWEAWQAGKFDLADIPKVTHSDIWGDSWTPKSLGDLLASGEAGQ